MRVTVVIIMVVGLGFVMSVSRLSPVGNGWRLRARLHNQHPHWHVAAGAGVARFDPRNESPKADLALLACGQSHQSLSVGRSLG
jgi:hypothetical protein